MQLGPKNDPGYALKLEETSRIYNQHRERFDRLRSDVGVKLRFLEENKVSFETAVSSVNVVQNVRRLY